jgi:thioesterase domain-containing protein
VPTNIALASQLERQPNGKIDRQKLLTTNRERPTPSIAIVPPRNELESRLVRIWQDVLNLPQVGVHDSFFALGGHSLSAVMAKFRIEEELQKKVPLATLFRATTVAQLAAELTKPETACDRSLVSLQETGHLPPLFLVHPTAGNALCYLELVRELGGEQPVYGLQSIGLDGQQPPRNSIVDMASAYASELVERQPDGPFVLGGWSMGGIVALEMAQQLVAQGREVPLLVVIDAPLLDANDQLNGTPAWRHFAVAELKNQLGDQSSVDQLVDQLPHDTLPSAEQLQTLLAQSPLADLACAVGSGEELRHHLAVIAANLKAHEEYRAQPYAGRVVLLSAEERLDSLPDCETQWRALVSGELAVHRVPGNHYTMLQAPHVQRLAEHFAAALC